MELFGIYVITDLEPTLRERFLRALAPWDLARPRDMAELAVRVVQGEVSRITIASTSRWPARRAGQLMAQAAGVTLVRAPVSWDRDVVEATVPVGDEEEVNRLLAGWAWGLFLWAATRHPERERWEGVEIVRNKPSTPVAKAKPARVQPRPAAAAKGVVVVHQSQSMVRGSTSGGAISRIRPPQSAPRRG